MNLTITKHLLGINLDTRVTGRVVIEDRAHFGEAVCVFVEHDVTFVFNELRERLAPCCM